MYLPQSKILLIHTPKTAGTFLEKWLLPLSDAEIVAGGWRDARNRFEIRGEFSGHKHMSIEEYRNAMPREIFKDLRVLCPVRHPVERCVSFYFSPHRWVMKKRSARLTNRVFGLFGAKSTDKPSHYRVVRPKFSLQDFENMLAEIPSMSWYLKQDHVFRYPDLLLRHERFVSDCADLAKTLAIEPPESSERVNATAASEGEFASCVSNKEVKRLVRKYHHEDFVNFDYD